jgi:DNA-binding NarL/FixJ family response regulator
MLKGIAQDLGFTQQTVQWYNKQILSKTGCRNRGELVRQISRTLASLLADDPR